MPAFIGEAPDGGKIICPHCMFGKKHPRTDFHKYCWHCYHVRKRVYNDPRCLHCQHRVPVEK